MASMADLRRSLKRDLSFGSTSSLQSALRAPKRWKSEHDRPQPPHRGGGSKVSFGNLNETVLFNKKHSSSNLSLGVSVSSVSNSSFGSVMSTTSSFGNLRWGEQHQHHQPQRNATWGAPPPPPPPFSGPHGAPTTFDSRWSTTATAAAPRPPASRNIFFSSSSSTATSNALRTLGANRPPAATANCYSQAMRAGTAAACSANNQTTYHHPTTTTSSLLQAPRRPGRCESPVTILPDPVAAPTTPGSSSSMMQPPKRPGRCASPVMIEPSSPSPTFSLAFSSSPSTSPVPVVGAPPRRPTRCSSPVTVTPRSSFNSGENTLPVQYDEDL